MEQPSDYSQGNSSHFHFIPCRCTKAIQHPSDFTRGCLNQLTIFISIFFFFLRLPLTYGIPLRFHTAIINITSVNYYNFLFVFSDHYISRMEHLSDFKQVSSKLHQSTIKPFFLFVLPLITNIIIS